MAVAIDAVRNVGWSAPTTLEYKYDVNQKQGLLTAYLTVYFKPGTQDPIIDDYNDWVAPGSFTKTITDLVAAQKARNLPYLCKNLWQHNPNWITGGVAALSEDSQGVIYETKMAKGVRLAEEVMELAEQRMVGSSFGYYAVRSHRDSKSGIRTLKELLLQEVSQVAFPANEYAPIIGVKDGSIFPRVWALGGLSQDEKRIMDSQFVADTGESEQEVKSVCGNTGLPIGPRDESWDATKARSQYQEWGTNNDGEPIASKYKQVHLQVDGDPDLLGSYKYPFCYIKDGSPVICVGGVKAAVGALSGARNASPGGDGPGMRAKAATMYGRINKKYPDAEPLVPPWSSSKARDFLGVWNDMQPDELMREYYRMEDALSLAVLENIKDNPQGDYAGAISQVVSQFGDEVTKWAKAYLSVFGEEMARVAGNEIDDYGLMSADRINLNIKRLADRWEAKRGMTLSASTRTKLLTALSEVRQQVEELHKFIDEHTPVEGGKSVRELFTPFWQHDTGQDSDKETPPHGGKPFPSFGSQPSLAEEVPIDAFMAEMRSHFSRR